MARERKARPMGRPVRPHTKDTPEWAKRLRQFREARGWSVRDLAELAGVPERSLAAYDRGDKEPQASVAVALARTLGTTVEHLFGE